MKFLDLDGLTYFWQKIKAVFISTTDVANEANKIPRYNADGHLVLPNGTEIW